MQYKAIILDFDGTIYDISGFAVRLVFSNLTSAFRMNRERKVRRLIEGNDYGDFAAYMAEFGKRLSALSKKSQEEEIEWYKNTYIPAMVRLIKKRCHPRKDFENFIETLYKKKIPVSIYSDYPQVPERLEALGVSKETVSKCAGVYGIDNFGAAKPAARPFLEIAKAMNTDPKDVLVIGDKDSTDGEGARKCGMGFIQLRTNKRKNNKILVTDHPVLEWDEVVSLLHSPNSFV